MALPQSVQVTEIGQPTPVPSPCISICQMDDASGLCEGCLRTIDEIAAWSTLPDAGKRAVLASVALRRRQQVSE